MGMSAVAAAAAWREAVGVGHNQIHFVATKAFTMLAQVAEVTGGNLNVKFHVVLAQQLGEPVYKPLGRGVQCVMGHQLAYANHIFLSGGGSSGIRRCFGFCPAAVVSWAAAVVWAALSEAPQAASVNSMAMARIAAISFFIVLLSFCCDSVYNCTHMEYWMEDTIAPEKTDVNGFL